MNAIRIKSSVEAALKVRPGEWRLLGRLAASFFLLFTCLIYGRSIRTALFLKTFGIDYLPEMYLVTYVVLAAASTLYSATVEEFDKKRMLAVTSVLFSVLYFISRPLITFPAYVVFIFVAVEISSILSIIQFWTLADDMYTVREKKRLFPPIMLLGLGFAAAAGIAMKLVVDLMGAENIFILLGVLMFVNYRVIGRVEISGNAKRGSADDPQDVARDSPTLLSRYSKQLMEGFSFIAKNNYMLAFTAMTAAIYLVNGVIEYEFANAAASSFTSLDELTRYFGLVQGAATFLAFLAQMFFTSRVIEALGIPVAVSIYPAAILVALSAMTAKFTLATGTAAKATNDFFLYSIHDTVSSVLLNPIPERLRGKARIFIQGIVRPAAAIVSSLFLIFATRAFSTSTICLFAIGLALLWFIASRVLGRCYLNVLVENLRSEGVDLRKYSVRTLKKLQSKGALQSLVRMLRADDEKTRGFAAHLLFNIGSTDAVAAVAELTADPSPMLRRLALKSIRRLGPDAYTEAVKGLTQDPDRETRVEAIETYARTCPEAAEFIWSMLEVEEDPQVKSALVRVAAGLLWGDPSGRALIKGLLDKFFKSQSASDKVSAATVIAELELKEHAEFLVVLLRDPEPDVVLAAMEALGKLKPDEAVLDLLSLLEDIKYSSAAYETLVKYRGRLIPYLSDRVAAGRQSLGNLAPLISLMGELGGEKLKPSLLELTEDRDESTRLAAFKALYRMQEGIGVRVFSSEEIFRLCKKETRVALETFYLLRRIERERAGAPGGFRAYRVLLKERFSVQKETLLAIMELTGEKEAVSILKESLKSSARKTRDCALEALETLLPAEVRRDFMLVFDDLPIEEKLRLIQKRHHFKKVPIEHYLVESARNGRMIERLCAVYDLGELGEAGYGEILVENASKDDPHLKEAAFLGLSKLGRVASAPFVEALKKESPNIAFLQRFGMI